MLLMILAAVLMLAACTGRVDTELRINADGSGVRTLSVSLERTGAAGGRQLDVDDVETVILSSLPDGMEYVGRNAASDGSPRFTFRIPFDSTRQYEQRVAEILEAGEVPDDRRGLELEQGSGPLRSGLRIDERFTSTDLLAWLITALIADGTVPADRADDLLESGPTRIVVDGATHDVDERISYDDLRGRGIDDVRIRTSGLDTTDGIQRTLELSIDPEAYAQDPEIYDDFLAGVTPPGGELSRGDDTDPWTLRFPPGSAAQVADWTDQALAASGGTLQVMRRAADEAPLRQVTTIESTVDCSAVCTNGGDVQQAVEVPAAWAPDEKPQASGTVELRLHDGQVTVDHPVAVSRVELAFTLHPTGESEADLALVLPAEAGPAELDPLRQWLGEDRTEVEEREESVRVTARYRAADPAQLAAMLGEQGMTGADGQGQPRLDAAVASRSPGAVQHRLLMDLALPRDLRELPGTTELTWSIRTTTGMDAPRTQNADPHLVQGPGGALVAAATLESPSIHADLEIREGRLVSAGLAAALLAFAVFALVGIVAGVRWRLRTAAER